MKCSFCGEQIREGTGSIYVLKTGKRFSFCSGKCEKNLLKLKRKPAATKWTAFHRAEKEKAGEKKGNKTAEEKQEQGTKAKEKKQVEA